MQQRVLNACIHSCDLLHGGECVPQLGSNISNLCLAAINGGISILAFVQLLRLHLYSHQSRWTRQKVFHCMIGFSAAGYCVHFVLNVVAACEKWHCWTHACGFIAMAVPQIIFLSTFLLLLSFWVDLCHQATDKDEEEEDDEETLEEDIEDRDIISSCSTEGDAAVHPDKHRRCCSCWRRSRIRGRQKFVIAVVVLIFLLTIGFALLIWIGNGDNPIDSETVAQVYSDMFAVVILLSGGGLAGYGLTLYTKMSRLRTGKTSRDLRKIAGLAVVSVVCFSVRALLVLLRDVGMFENWNGGVHFFLMLLYYLIGEVIPCVVVLWVMRDVPQRSCRGRRCSNESPVNGYHEALAQEQALLQQWIIPEDLESLIVVSRSRKSRSEIGSSEESTSTSG